VDRVCGPWDYLQFGCRVQCLEAPELLSDDAAEVRGHWVGTILVGHGLLSCAVNHPYEVVLQGRVLLRRVVFVSSGQPRWISCSRGSGDSHQVSGLVVMAVAPATSRMVVNLFEEAAVAILEADRAA